MDKVICSFLIKINIGYIHYSNFIINAFIINIMWFNREFFHVIENTSTWSVNYKLITNRDSFQLYFRYIVIMVHYQGYGLPQWLSSKETICKCRRGQDTQDMSSIPGGGRCNPPQYSCLENLMDTGAWQDIIQGYH